MADEEVEAFRYIGQNGAEITGNATRVVVDTTVTEIAETAFFSWVDLVSVELPEGLRVIGKLSLANCKALVNVTFPSSLQIIRETAFYACTSLISLDFPEGLRIIGDSAFAGCLNLSTICFPSSLEEIRRIAFADCLNLASFDLPTALVHLGDQAFQNCQTITTCNFPPRLKEIKQGAFRSCINLSSVDFSEGLTSIFDYAFQGCSSLVGSLRFPSTLRELRDVAFQGCGNLATVEFPQGLRVLGRRAFDDCKNIQVVRNPALIKTIESAAFDGCNNLLAIDFNEGLQFIGEYALADCNSLSHLRIPSTVREIQRSALTNCTSLFSIEFTGTRLTFVGQQAFDGCRNLRNLMLPLHVYEFGDGLFSGCKGLRMPFPNDLNEVEENELDDDESNFFLVNRFQYRFDDLPIHKLCYSQAFHPSTDELIRQMRRIYTDTNVSAVDAFGMSPFHFLALSSKPNLDLFQELVQITSVDLALKRDNFGNPPIYYLCKNDTAGSIAIIKYLIRMTVMDRLSCLGLEQWRVDMSNHVDEFSSVEASARVDRIGFIHQEFAKYKRLEGTSLMEEFLWKMKIEELEYEIDHVESRERSFKKAKIDEMASISTTRHAGGIYRGACRINCGADIVIPNVLEFLGKVEGVLPFDSQVEED